MTESQRYDVLLLVFFGTLVGIFLYSVHAILSPVLLLACIAAVAIPMRHYRAVKGVLAVVALIFCVWFFSALSGVLLPVWIALILAYMLDPLIDRAMRWKLPRLAAVIAVMLLFLGFVVLAFIIAVPAIAHSFQTFQPNEFARSVTVWIDTVVIPWLVSLGISQTDIQSFINTKILPHVESLTGSIVGSISNVALGVTALLGQLANAVVIPILMFYILLDWDRIKRWVKELFPESRRGTAVRLYRKIDRVLAAYLRGAITIALINSVVVTTCFSIIGTPFPIVLGILSGLFTLIPQFGVLITMVIVSLVSLIAGATWSTLLLSVVVLLGENLLESSVLYPKIVGEALGLHPAALIISLLVFAYFFGFIGMLIAVPLTSLFAQLLDEWLERRDAAHQLLE